MLGLLSQTLFIDRRRIEIAATEGIGWLGILERLLGPDDGKLPNVYQRLFARSSGVGG